jgi:hypothetical protein
MVVGSYTTAGHRSWLCWDGSGRNCIDEQVSAAVAADVTHGHRLERLGFAAPLRDNAFEAKLHQNGLFLRF